MFRITLALGGLADRELALGALAVGCDALVKLNLTWLEARPKTPALSTCQLHVVTDPQGTRHPGRDAWQDIPTTLAGRRDGRRVIGGVDFVAWRVAELRLRGVLATVGLQVRGNEIGSFVRLPNGQREDWPCVYRTVEPWHRFTFVVDLFNGPHDRQISDRALVTLLDALTTIDEAFLRKHPETPDIYQSGVRYVEEPPGQEDWQDIATCLRMKRADCDDLACWLASQRRVRQNVPARPIYKSQSRKDGGVLYHIQTSVGGRIEDPSWVLGMR